MVATPTLILLAVAFVHTAWTYPDYLEEQVWRNHLIDDTFVYSYIALINVYIIPCFTFYVSLL